MKMPVAAPQSPRTAALLALSVGQRRTLEALADTVVPGRKRSRDDVAIAGVSETPGAVEAGALYVMADPAAGIEDGIGAMADELDAAAAELAGEPTATMVSLPYDQRRRLVAKLTAADRPDRDLWFLMALFAYMAYDSAPHLNTAAAIADGHPGLHAMGFRGPGPDGRWRFEPSSYSRPLARMHPATDVRGNLP